MVERFVPRVKVCGVRTLEVALAALESGADAIGFVEHERSPRAISSSLAAELVRAIGPRARTVAVMVDRSPRFAREWLERTGVGAVQLCGAEEPDEWRAFARPILRRVAVDESAERELELWRDVADAFVLDHPSSAGGSGRAVDFERARDLARLAPCLLAGGLDAASVEAAVERVLPRGVDASSKLESSAGVKDVRSVREFVIRARAALDRCEVP